MRLFDLHCDTLYEMQKNSSSLLHNNGHIDLQRGMTFSPWYQCFAVFVNDSVSEKTAKALVNGMLQKAYTTEKQYPKLFSVLRNKKDWFHSPVTNCTAVLTIENGGAAAGADAFPAYWVDCGVKMVSLTWNGENRWATGCEGGLKCGLTTAGKNAVRRMQEVGMILDLAHLNRYGFWQVCSMTDRPLAVSHTACAAIYPCRRNLTDRQFQAIKQRNGLVGLDFCESHLGEQTIDRFIVHLEHFLALGGKRTVALGTDLDGISLPENWNGIRILETLYDRLLQRNYAESLIDDIFFDNAYRFFKIHCC